MGGLTGMLSTGSCGRAAALGLTLALLAFLPATAWPANDGQVNLQAPESPGPPTQPPPNSGSSDGRKQSLAVNPVTGQTTAFAANYRPLTGEERWRLYFKQSCASVGAYVGPFLAALILDQARGDPRQWGGGFPGFGRRMASRLAAGDIVQNSVQFSAAALLHEDVRYIASNQHGFKARIGHAILYSLLTYNNQGHPTLNVANLTGYYASSGVSTLWLPGRHRLWSYALSDGSGALALSVPVNMFQEFWPEIHRALPFRK